MKIIKPSAKFKRRSKRLDQKTNIALNERLFIFENNEFDQILNNHKLNGEYTNCRSINITSDIRLIYKKLDENLYLFVNIGTHSELYS